MTIEFFEDIEPGTALISAPQTVTAEEIIEFAREFDPIDFHLDPEIAANSMLGGLAASGWHLCAIMMRMTCDMFLEKAAGQGSPGVEKCEWLKPVFAGDQVTGKITFDNARPSASRPDLGIVTMRCEIFVNETVLAFRMINPFMMKRRPSS